MGDAAGCTPRGTSAADLLGLLSWRSRLRCSSRRPARPWRGWRWAASLAVLMLAGRRWRIWATAALLVVQLPPLLWIHHTRGPTMAGHTGSRDQFRIMMWQDGMRLIGQHPWFGVGMETIRTIGCSGTFARSAFSRRKPLSQRHDPDRGGAWAARRWLRGCGSLSRISSFLLRLDPARRHSRFATGVVLDCLPSFVAFSDHRECVHYNLGRNRWP